VFIGILSVYEGANGGVWDSWMVGLVATPFGGIVCSLFYWLCGYGLMIAQTSATSLNANGLTGNIWFFAVFGGIGIQNWGRRSLPAVK
jgi:hypothetical protein